MVWLVQPYYYDHLITHNMAAIGPNWCYTKQNYTPDDVVYIQGLTAKYNLYGHENAPTTGTKHLQGLICFEKNKRFNAVRKLLGCHVELCRNVGASINYIKIPDAEKGKTGDFWESAEEPLKKNQKNSDRITFDDVVSCADWEEVLRIPNIACKLTWAKECWRKKSRPIENLPGELRPWQKEEIELLLKQDDRKIRFVVDYQGGMGKTVLAKYLVQEHKAFYTRGGKHADIAYAYDHQEIVVFDLSRSNEETHWPYPIMENFKDGMLFSGKYESATKTFPSCKVIVMCNQAPDQSKLSHDRFDIIEVTRVANLDEQMNNK